jgi:hypothetical protein
MLAVLQGSEKQVSWAKKIRKDKMDQWKSSDPIVFQRVEPDLHSMTLASWWITYREKSLIEVLMYVQGGGGSGNATVKPKTSIDSTSPASFEKKTCIASGDDGGITRYVGELRDAVTGEVVVDAECPF